MRAPVDNQQKLTARPVGRQQEENVHCAAPLSTGWTASASRGPERAPARGPSPGSPLFSKRALAVDGYARLTKKRAPAGRHPRSPHDGPRLRGYAPLAREADSRDVLQCVTVRPARSVTLASGAYRAGHYRRSRVAANGAPRLARSAVSRD